mmetsp:Transcript_9532/g.24469  ORF Transcript_9532/g.24469 Transcript_9532/m.24469 type:complete len:238 (+) Transcript_9532:434-1147(+)
MLMVEGTPLSHREIPLTPAWAMQMKQIPSVTMITLLLTKTWAFLSDVICRLKFVASTRLACAPNLDRAATGSSPSVARSTSLEVVPMGGTAAAGATFGWWPTGPSRLSATSGRKPTSAQIKASTEWDPSATAPQGKTSKCVFPSAPSSAPFLPHRGPLLRRIRTGRWTAAWAMCSGGAAMGWRTARRASFFSTATAFSFWPAAAGAGATRPFAAPGTKHLGSARRGRRASSNGSTSS